MDRQSIHSSQLPNQGLQVRYLSDSVTALEEDDEEHDKGIVRQGDETNEFFDCKSRHDNGNLSSNKMQSSYNDNAGDLMNRASFARLRSRSMSLIQRPSSASKKRLVENSYRMEPMPDQYFIWWKVRNVIHAITRPVFDDFHYDAKSGAGMCKLMGNKIITTLKRKFDWPRFRYVCHVTIAQLKEQGLIIADRSLWTANIDNCAICVFKNKSAVCVVTVHGIYME